MEDFKMALDTEKIIADLKEASILELNVFFDSFY